MNVVQRDNRLNLTSNPRANKNELVRRDVSLGIRGTNSLPTIKSFNFAAKIPRYQLGYDEVAKAKRHSMGPPLEPPRSSKRKPIATSSSTKQDSSGIPASRRPRVLVSDTTAADTSADFCTPRNRPSTLRYISSSSRGGYSGTRSARSTSTSVIEASVILAISEGRGQARGEVGMAAVDLRHPGLVLCQFSDTLLYTHTLTKINYFNPVEIIVPHTFCEGAQTNQLYQLIKDQFPTINLTTVQRRHFNDAAGRQQIQTLCHPQYSAVYLQALHKFYALTSAAAVLKYVEYIQCIVFARESLKIVYHSSENTMIIDVGTATQLELVQPLVRSAGPACSLLGVLGPTYTTGGIRALRAAILQPSFNGEFIENRLDAVQDLIENDNGLMMGLQDVIKKLSDIDKILFLCVESPAQNMEKMGEAQLNQTLLLKTTMDLVPKLVEALGYAESGRLKKMKMDIENPHYKEISDRIRTILHEDAHLEKGVMGSLQRCFAVKADINGLLDVARRMYSELIEDIQKMVEQLSETYDLPIRLNQNALKGFHIVMSLGPRNRRDFKAENLPDVFIQVQNNGASVSMTTEELVVLDQQAKESLNEIQKMSNVVIGGLLKDLRPFMYSLYGLCENVAELDILLALAHASSVGSYIRPEFADYLDVRNSVHPLLDYNSQTLPVPNDIYASPEHNFTVITGPNMGGKSIYIKQIAIMHIMAQIGCFLPATKAVLRLSDRVFSRIGFNDSVELNASTFVLEMKEIQHVLKDLTKTSLVIIDELCRGTSTEEGTSMAWAICEELLSSDTFTFFTTHFMYLTRLRDLYYNVVNLHTLVTEEEIPSSQPDKPPQRRLVYQHKVEEGVTAVEHYGLALASKTNIPEETVNLAKELAELIVKTRTPQEIKSPDKKDEQILYNLHAEILKLKRKSDNPDETKRRMLKEFKTQNPELIHRLKSEKSLTDSLPRPTESSNILSSKTPSEKDRSNQRIDESGYSFGGVENGTNVYQNTDVMSVQTSNELLNTFLKNDDRTQIITVAEIHNKPTRKLASDSDNTEKQQKIKPRFSAPLRISDSDSPLINNRETTLTNDTEKKESQSFQNMPNNQLDASHSNFHESQSCSSLPINQLDESFTNLLEDIPLPSSSELQHKYANMFVQNEIIKPAFMDIDKSHTSSSSNEEIQRIFEENEKSDIDQENKGQEMDTDVIEVIEESDEDIAEALTQVLEEFESKSSGSEDMLMSGDKQLMEETVNEIREALSNGNVDDIILTPPIGFRDEF